jgi:GGDEF domain-containing protein
LTLAERIRTRIASHAVMTASIGIATLNCESVGIPADAQSLLREADAAMYEAKRRGKNTVVAGGIIGKPEVQEVAVPPL